MIRIRRGTAAGVRARRPGLIDVDVAYADGSTGRAVAYPALCGPLIEGDRLVLNTTAVALGLGTGGIDFVIAVESGADTDPDEGVHAMKLRYTPLQVPVAAIEESGVPLPDGLDGMPVVAAGLHSAIAPVAIGIRAAAASLPVALVMTDAAALPLALSDTVAELQSEGLLATTVTCGQAFGGEVEAVNVYTGMLAARAAGARVAIVAMGPGNLGTGSRYGFAAMEVAGIVNAAASLGGTPIAVPRVGFGDARERHNAVSHHTITALGDAAYATALVALPALEAARDAAVRKALAPLTKRHRIVNVDLGEAEQALRASPVSLHTMGRSFEDEPDYFRVAAAAGVLAARLETGPA